MVIYSGKVNTYTSINTDARILACSVLWPERLVCYAHYCVPSQQALHLRRPFKGLSRVVSAYGSASFEAPESFAPSVGHAFSHKRHPLAIYLCTLL